MSLDASRLIDEAASLRARGRIAEAADAYGAAALLEGETRFTALLGLARSLSDLGRPAEAEAPCRAAVALDPGRPFGHAMLALVLVELERLDDAAVAARAALDRAPFDLSLLNLSASIALRRGRPEDARRFSSDVLKVDKHNQRAISDLIPALRRLGEHAAADRLADPGRLARSLGIDPPAGFASAQAFNLELIEAITAHDALEPALPGSTLVGGARLHDSFSIRGELAAGLRQVFLQAARGYPAAVKLDEDHPVITGRPDRPRISSWANVIQSGRYERPHIHESGWLSGVYYVEVPAGGGELLLGGHHGDGPFAEPTLTITPRPGLLVVFPSYLYHRTRPFHGAGRRISIAFDVARA